MFLQNAIEKRIDDDNPVKVALIGAGKFWVNVFKSSSKH